MKYQNYPHRLADVFDETYFDSYSHYVSEINNQLDEQGFQMLKELLVIIKTKGQKDSFDDGYEQGYDDGYLRGYEE